MGTIVNVQDERRLDVSQSFYEELKRLTVCKGVGMNQLRADASMLYTTIANKIAERKARIAHEDDAA